MSKLLIQSGTPDATGCVLNITPESAGWRHIGFQVHRLAPTQIVRGGTGERETCLVVLAGTADISVDDQHFKDIGHRGSVFDDAAPGAVYAPAGRTSLLISAAVRIPATSEIFFRRQRKPTACWSWKSSRREVIGRAIRRTSTTRRLWEKKPCWKRRTIIG